MLWFWFRVIKPIIHYRSHCDQERYVHKVENYASHSSPKEIDVTSANAFAEEDAVVIIIFNANFAFFTVVSLIISLNHALIAP